MKLSKNFSLNEFTRSMTATRLGIENNPDKEHLKSAIRLFKHVVQPVRDHFGTTRISSGYRSPALNEAIGGSTKSQHSKGQAVDFECDGADNAEVCQWIVDNLDFDQVILEFYTKGEPHSGWVHVSYVSPEENRNRPLTAVKEGGKTKYLLGLQYD
tara:strand:- start:6098 stop:6565 length:468 start_codon:yes stop_codon:yes gene_type:complete